MKKSNHFGFMIDFVKDYLNGDNSRLDFDLDFNHYLIQHYPGMERENPEAAECFAFYMSEDVPDHTESLSDTDHSKFIRGQFDKFNEAINDGLW